MDTVPNHDNKNVKELDWSKAGPSGLIKVPYIMGEPIRPNQIVYR